MATRYTIADGDITDTGENCVWDYNSVPGDKGIPSNGDAAVIAHTCTMSTGTLSLASLTMQGEAEVSDASLAISGGSLIALSLTIGTEVTGFSISDGSLEVTASTLQGPEYALGLSYLFHQTGGTLTINANCQGGASGTTGDPPDAHGSGGELVYKTAGTLVINGNCVGGTGASGEMGDPAEPFSDIGGSVLEAEGSSGSITINGNLALASGQDELSGHAVISYLSQPCTVNGDVTGGAVQRALLVNTMGTHHVYGKLIGRNQGKFVLTGELSTDEGDAWAYYVCSGVTLDLTNLDLANAGTFCVTAAGGTVTTTGAEVTNAEGAQFAAVGCTIPTVNWYDPMAAAVWPDEANVLPVETAWGPTGAEYAGALVCPTAEEIVAAIEASGSKLDSLYDLTEEVEGVRRFVSSAMEAWMPEAETLAAIAAGVLTADIAGAIEAAAAEYSLTYVILGMSQFDTTAELRKVTVFRSDGTTIFASKPVSTAPDMEMITKIAPAS